MMKRHFAAGGTTSQVLQSLALVIESGCAYCAILVIAAITLDLPARS